MSASTTPFAPVSTSSELPMVAREAAVMLGGVSALAACGRGVITRCDHEV